LAENSKKINDEKKEEKDGSRKRKKKDKFDAFIIDAEKLQDDKQWKEESPADEIERSYRYINLTKY